MAKVLQAKLNVATAAAERKVARPGPSSSRGRERVASSTATRNDLRPTLDLDEALLALQRRAPVPTIGPSHWWG